MHEQKLQAPHSGGAKKVSPKLLEKGSYCSSSSAPTFPQFPSAQNCVLVVRGVRKIYMYIPVVVPVPVGLQIQRYPIS